MTISYQVEKLDTVYEEVQALLKMHWEEIGTLKSKITLNIAYDMYKQLENLNKLYILTVRDDGVLVGYFVAVVNRNLHYKDEVWAQNDIMFLHPEYRKALIGYTMIKEAERGLKEMGATVSSIHTNVKYPLDALMKRLEYEPSAIYYIRKL